MPSNNSSGRIVTASSGPYVGPRPFTQEDRDVFFGRTQEAIELTSLVKAHPEVVLYAQSGAGKSSLLFAQVMPILDVEEEFDVLPVGRVRSQESAPIPDYKINNIYMFNALKDLSENKLSVMECAQLTLADFLKSRPRPPLPSKETADGHQTDNPDNQEKRLARAVIFDQFEEIFTLYPERYKDRQDFFNQVAQALKEDPFLRVIFSMREDYIAEVEPYVSILPQSLRTRYRLERLRKANALSAVKQPLETKRFKNTGRRFVDGAAQTLVDRLMLIKVKTASGEKVEAPGEFVDPVQLQVVCQTLWEKLPPEKTEITKADIEKYANVEEALLDFYESCIRKAVAAVNRLDQPEAKQISEGLVRGWIEQKLITREGKRNMVFRERDDTAGLSNLVIDELENSHLTRVEMRGGEPWYELSHDRFIPPIRESNRRFLLKQPYAKRKAEELEARASEWKAKHRSNDLLLNRGELVDAQNWMATDAAAIGYSETLFAFIRASEAAVEHEDNKRRQELADAQQRQMIAERQRARQLRLGFLVTSVLLLFTISSTGFAIVKWRKANEAEQEAHADRKLAEASNAVATYNSEKRKEALDQALKEEQKAREAARELQIVNSQVEEARKKAEEARVFADTQKSIAEAARRDAEIALNDTKAAQAKTEAALAETARVNEQLIGFQKTLEESRNRAWSHKLSSDANEVLLRDPEKALRLALEATERMDTPKAQWALRRAFLEFKARSILRGHEQFVYKAAYGPGGQVFSVSEDGYVRIWDAQTAKEQKNLYAGAAVHAFAVSSDGVWLATEEFDNTGRIWNLRDGSYKVLPDLSGPVAALALSPDGRVVATEATTKEGEPGATPRIWEVTSGKMLFELKGHTEPVSAIAFSPNSNLLATASWDNTARIWDVKTGKELAVLNGHTEPLTSVAFDGTGQLLVTASFDGSARVWNVATGQEKFLLGGPKRHAGVVVSATFSPDNRRIVTAGRALTDKIRTTASRLVPLSEETRKRIGTPDNTARIWNVETGDLIATLQGHNGGINSAVYSSDGQLILTASEDTTVIVWDATTKTIMRRLEGHGAPVNTAVFGPNNATILTASDDGTAQVWNWRNSGYVNFQADTRSVLRVDQTRNDSIITGAITGAVRFWDLNGVSTAEGTEITINSLLTSPSQGAARLYDLAVSPSGDSVVISSVAPTRLTRTPIDNKVDNKAHVWNVRTKSFDRHLEGHNEPVTKVLFSSNGRYLATMSAKRVQVWTTSNYTPIKIFNATSKEVSSREANSKGATSKDATSSMAAIAFTGTDESFLVAEDNGSLSKLKLSTGEVEASELHTNIFRTAAFSSDGKLIAFSTERGEVVVWNTNGVKVSSLRAFPGSNPIMVFSPKGGLLLTVGLDRKVRIWNTSSGERIEEFDPLQEAVASVAFGKEGRSVIVGGARGGVYIVDCDLCLPFNDVKKLAQEKNPRELTPQEHEEYLPGEKTP